jgi:hypothetical protein
LQILKPCSWLAILLTVFCPLLCQGGGGDGVQAQEGEWSTPVNLSNTPAKSWLPSACADRAGNIHVLWAEFVDAKSTTSDTVYYTMWDGQRWTDPADIVITGAGPASQAFNAVWYPACAADDLGRLHLVWTDTHSIYYSQAYINGEPWKATAWSTPLVVYPNPTAPGGMPHMAVDSQGGIHIVFNTYDRSYHIASTDGGQSWSDPVSMAVTPDRATRPRIFVDDQDVLHVGITEVNEMDNGIGVLYSRSLDGGRSWEDAQQLDGDTGAQDPIWAVVGMDGKGMLHAVWPARYDKAFYHQMSDDRGRAWSQAEPMGNTVGEAGFGWPAMAMDSAGTLHLLLSTNDNISHYQWDGSEWTGPEDVSRTETSSNMPSLVVSGGNLLHAIWMEYAPEQEDVHASGNTEIYHSVRTVAAPARPPAGFSHVTTTPVPTGTSRPVVQATATAVPTRVHVSSTKPEAPTSEAASLLTGILLSAALMAVVVTGRGLLGRK